jgi:protein-S-isoprenylcysteine O-methyltransferase Ste14
MQLVIRSLVSALAGLVALGVVIFVPAGTIAYWQGWVFILVFTACSTLTGIYLGLKDPALLDRRVKGGPLAETRPVQKILITLIIASFFAMTIVSALDFRFGWSRAPAWVAIAGNALVVLGLYIDLLVLRENSFSAATIRRMEGQRVITTGPYAVVRHPMYVGALIMVAGVPLALGSYWGELFVLVDIPILVLRILDEEAMLHQELEGYADYARGVRSRLVPGLW